jgi:peptidoglycan/LPS O-acetylase OafA/YrhL
VAILLVMAHNFGVPAGVGGYLGVDLFFVLSGYLITGLLLDERQAAGRVRLGRFYARRALRLLPALAALLAVLGAYLLVFASRETVALRLPGMLATLFYAANWMLGLMPDGSGRLGPLAHAWSLSVEEQFYLLWPPALLLFLARGAGRRSLLLGLGAGVFASAAWRAALHLHGSPPLRLYAGTDTRADALLLGCLVAVAVGGPASVATRRRAAAVGWIGLASLLVLAMTVPWRSPALYLGLFTAAGVFAVLAILGALGEGGSYGAVLRSPVLRWVGIRSYGIYLWHFPIAKLLAQRSGVEYVWESPRLLLAATLASLAVAWGSFRFLERPALRFRRRFAALSE